MRIQSSLLIFFVLNVPLVSYGEPASTFEAAGRCGLFRAQGYVPRNAKDEIVFNPDAVSRIHVKVSNPEKIARYVGLVVDTKIWIERTCAWRCQGHIEEVVGIVAGTTERVKPFAWRKESQLISKSCLANDLVLSPRPGLRNLHR